LNIVEPILAQARYQPHSVALCTAGERHSVITYAQVAHMMRGIAQRASAVGLLPGDVTVIFVDDPILHSLLLLGLAHMGVVTISGRNPDLPKEIKIHAILCDAPRQFSGGHRVIQIDPSWMQNTAAPTRPHGGHEDTCRIIFTSGTTGDAKAVAYSHRMVIERAVRFDYLAGNLLGASLRLYIDLGFATSLGYLFLIRTLMRGGMLVLPGSIYEHVLNACDLYGVESWIGAPGGLVSLMDYLEKAGGRRCNFRAMLAGGSFLSKTLSERVRLRACSNLISAYGSTETNMVATAPAFVTVENPGAVGFLTPGMTVESVTDTHERLPLGQEGLIRVRGPYNVPEYVGDPLGTAQVFRGGWFYSGDIGSLTSDNLLIITGRQKTVMNIGGDKIKPEHIEDVLITFREVEEAGVLSFTNELGLEEVWALVVVKPDFDERKLLRYCLDQLPASFVPRRIVKAERLPRNEMGKLDRQGLAALAKQLFS
jgi:acyl-CoA synthetase (AMP-forming)/AMP-acid ligase II